MMNRIVKLYILLALALIFLTVGIWQLATGSLFWGLFNTIINLVSVVLFTNSLLRLKKLHKLEQKTN